MLSSTLLHRLGLLNLYARRSFVGKRQGMHKSLRRGHGIEFSDYREYQPGDNPRHIDWPLYARSDRVYVKTFQEEQNLSVLVAVDTSASMRDKNFEAKWQTVTDLVLALSYIALLEQDEVTVHGMGSFVLPKLYGVRTASKIEKTLTECKTGDPESFLKDLRRVTQAMKFPGVALVISDFMFPMERCHEWFLSLAKRNIEVNFIQVLGSADNAPFREGLLSRVIDSESNEEIDLRFSDSEYQSELKAHNLKLRSFCNEHRIGFASLNQGDDLFLFLTKKLAAIGLIQ